MLRGSARVLSVHLEEGRASSPSSSFRRETRSFHVKDELDNPSRPSRLPSPVGKITRSRRTTSRFARAAMGAIVAVMLAQTVFLLWGCDWDLCGDEAEYWAWSRKLAWSYFSRGPVIAWLIRLGTELLGGLSLKLTGSLMFAVRFPCVVLGGLTAWAIFRLAVLTTGASRTGLIAVLLLPAIPVLRSGGVIVTSDTPLVCCWAWAAVWATGPCKQTTCEPGSRLARSAPSASWRNTHFWRFLHRSACSCSQRLASQSALATRVLGDVAAHRRVRAAADRSSGTHSTAGPGQINWPIAWAFRPARLGRASGRC